MNSGIIWHLHDIFGANHNKTDVKRFEKEKAEKFIMFKSLNKGCFLFVKMVLGELRSPFLSPNRLEL
jgi:hypothetical protein